MINTDYRIEALDFLLCGDCLIERYHPLIAPKKGLVAGLKELGCRRKNDAAASSDGELLPLLSDPNTVALFRRFLTLYDPKPQKFREIAKLAADGEEQAVLTELYHLPGVKYIRASLYCLAGYRTLKAVAETTAEELLSRTAAVIAGQGLSCSVPLPKEARTHIAVAKAFSD